MDMFMFNLIDMTTEEEEEAAIFHKIYRDKGKFTKKKFI